MKHIVPSTKLLMLLLYLSSCFVSAGATCNTHVTEKARKDSDIHLELAQNYLKEGDFISARREGVLAIEKDPQNWDAHYTLAYIFGQLKDWSNALKHAKLAIKHKGHYPEAENLVGTALIHKGDLDEAVKVLTGLTEDFMYTTPHLAYGNLGLAYFKMEEYQKALAALKKAVQLSPIYCTGYFWMGKVYYEMERYKDALESLEKCVSIEYEMGDCRGMQDAYVLMGDIRLKLKTPDLALENYETCYEINPNNAAGIQCKKKVNEIEGMIEEDQEQE